MTLKKDGRIDLDKPRYDQSSYWNRAKHFFITTNPLTILASSAQLDEAKSIVTRYRAGEDLPGLTEDDLWNAKNLYDSTFHPETQEKMFFLGRMSFQVPGNMFITGCLLQFYKTRNEVIFWQWFNQTFNATVNYTNRSGTKSVSLQRLGISYVLATSGAVVTALTINRTVNKLPPIVGRLVPFVAVVAANCINIPCMRSQEVTEGIAVSDIDGRPLGESPKVAQFAITQVVISRVCMAMPIMLIPPFLMNSLEKRGVLSRYRWLGAPLQILVCGIILTFATPMCCALFPQRASYPFEKLEPELQAKIRASDPNPPSIVYYNKGL